MASGSLILFPFDINLTYLVCNGQEELFRYYPTKIIIVSINGQMTLMTIVADGNHSFRNDIRDFYSASRIVREFF